MSRRAPLPEPVCFYEGKLGLRNWWRFGDGDGAVVVTEGPCSRGHSIICHTDKGSHSCIHAKALERHLGVCDFRNVQHDGIQEESPEVEAA